MKLCWLCDCSLCTQGCVSDGHEAKDRGPDSRGDQEHFPGWDAHAHHHGGLWGSAPKGLQVCLSGRPGKVREVDCRIWILLIKWNDSLSAELNCHKLKGFHFGMYSMAPPKKYYMEFKIRTDVCCLDEKKWTGKTLKVIASFEGSVVWLF